MSQAREIRGQIASVKSTQKITRAMELVAASKMRKAQERMRLSKPYASKMRKVIAHVAASHSETHHSYLQERPEPKRVGYIVVTTDRGLCGGLNINLLRKLLAEIKQHEANGVKVSLCLIGRKAELFFNRFGGNIVASTSQLGDKPDVQDLIGVVQVMLKAYDKNEIDAVYIIANDFVNTMSQKPVVRQLLPVKADPKEAEAYWDYIYEPDESSALLKKLLVRYIESQVYQAVIENIACEQSARMIAMKSATDNAGEIIKDLQLIYNKARQASITRELSEIVAGAAAVGD